MVVLKHKQLTVIDSDECNNAMSQSFVHSLHELVANTITAANSKASKSIICTK